MLANSASSLLILAMGPVRNTESHLSQVNFLYLLHYQSCIATVEEDGCLQFPVSLAEVLP